MIEMSYVTGTTIKELRIKKNLTQKQLADEMQISDKTISKWETNRGLPDIGLIDSLANCLGVSIAELLTGDYAINSNRSANMRKTKFYVCPVCGNVVQAAGEGIYTCCGITLPELITEEDDENHKISVELDGHEFYVHLEHAMTKQHYISFIAYVTSSRIQFVKLYPEQSVEARFTKIGHGVIYAYCNQHGLFSVGV
jgi:DNA-binding XRE family transcriptional regulator/desulfoferrodoxin (superoxide reductase-like protein)